MEPKPGDGLKSLKTSNVFRVINFELYATPNKVIMGLGLVAIAGCAGYLAYMRNKAETAKYVVDENDRTVMQRKSKWD